MCPSSTTELLKEWLLNQIGIATWVTSVKDLINICNGCNDRLLHFKDFRKYLIISEIYLIKDESVIEMKTSNRGVHLQLPIDNTFHELYTYIENFVQWKKTFSLTLQYQLIVLLTYFLGYSILWHLGFKSELLNVTAAEDMRDVMISMKYSTDPLACSITHFVCWHAWHVVISTMQLQNFHKHSIHTSELLDEIDV